METCFHTNVAFEDTRAVISTAPATGTSAQEIWDLCLSTSWPTSSTSRGYSCTCITKNRTQVTTPPWKLPPNPPFTTVSFIPGPFFDLHSLKIKRFLAVKEKYVSKRTRDLSYILLK